jgi:hypothetical protein
MAAPIAPPTKYATTPKISRNIPPVVAWHLHACEAFDGLFQDFWYVTKKAEDGK